MTSTITLTIVDGPFKGKSFNFNTRTICWVGRQSSCTIQFPDVPAYEKVSRLHCLIDIDPPKISIRDFNSRQGTFVDMVLIGRRESGKAAPGMNADIKPVEKNLYSGNIIAVGDVHIKVTITGEQPDYTPSVTPQLPNMMQLVADRAIGLLKNLWGLPNNTPGGKPQQDINAIGGNRIVREIGAGGYGKVFLAENRKGEQIAIKVMLAEVAATPAKVKMFEREIDNAKALNHPNIVRLIDNGFDPSNNCLYYAMEYCAGDNLATFMKKMDGILALDQAKRIILQILDGLEYTHNAEIPYVRLADGTFGKGYGLVHRDLKPSNIMLAKSTLGQTAKIGDFGLSKAFDLAGLSGHTMSGDGFRGTPHFMCRKQVLEFQQAKPEVDVWAVAACLYYMLTAQYPRNIRNGEGWEVLLERKTIPILDRNPDLPISLADVIDRALAEDANNQEALHYQRVRDFKTDLTQAFKLAGIT
jgi:eukaryotic-like serine/threonine-protein kinase